MNRTVNPTRPIGDLLRMLIAPMIWFVHLAIVYAAEALICLGPPAAASTSMTWAILLSTAAALAGFAVLTAMIVRAGNAAARAPDRTDARFLRAASLFLTLLSALAVLWTILPTAFLPACATAAAVPLGVDKL